VEHAPTSLTSRAIPAKRAARTGRWLLAVVIGAAVFEAVDALSAGSGSSLNGRPAGPFSDVLLWLPVVSPGVAGLVAAWAAPPKARAGLSAAVAAVWVRIGADRLIGVVQGAQLPPETSVVLILAFGLPWMITALAGALLVVVGRAVLPSRRRGRRLLGPYGSSPRVM
jgi:hypothetical protein